MRHTPGVPETPDIVIVGPTASGKSRLGIEVARVLVAGGQRAEIVSGDAMCVYREMTIGTAKPTVEEQQGVAHHLIDVCDPDHDYSVAEFQVDARAAIEDIHSRAGVAILVGGTGLYIQSVADNFTMPGQFREVRAELDNENDIGGLYAQLKSLDPLAASRMEPTNQRRIVRALEVCIGSGKPFSSYGPGITAFPAFDGVMFGLTVERDVLDARIARRFAKQLEDGFVHEVMRLRQRSSGWCRTARQGLGYKELAAHLDGEYSLEEAAELSLKRIRTFARRQQRWFRRDPRVTWVEPLEINGLATMIVRDWNICVAK